MNNVLRCKQKEVYKMEEINLNTQLAKTRWEKSTPVAIGNRIKKLRTDKKLSQAELSKLLQLNTHSTISKIENGFIAISYETAIKYADKLGCTPEYILFGITEESPLKHMDEKTYRFVRDPENYKAIQNLMIDREIQKLQAMKK